MALPVRSANSRLSRRAYKHAMDMLVPHVGQCLFFPFRGVCLLQVASPPSRQACLSAPFGLLDICHAVSACM